MDKNNPQGDEPEDIQPDPLEPHEEESIKEKFAKHIKNDKIDTLYTYAQENTRDTVAYALLGSAWFCSFFKPSGENF